MFHVEHYDIVVVGGGHAGIEACYISSQFGLKVALITLPGVAIGSAPCNPSVGGVGKGQVVKELDALGGAMGILADKAGIQFRTLNESKGYAVQSTRVQIDKELYANFATELLEALPSLDIFYNELTSIEIINGGYKVICPDRTIECSKVVVTVGTFLNGKLHTGKEVVEGGRVGCKKTAMDSVFKDIECRPLRFKTGTPARLDKNSINYEVLEEQPSDCSTWNFHLLNKPHEREQRQVSCYLTRTKSETMEIIRANKEHSPLFNGQIKGVGARYCPSIEDKAYRYPEKSVHHVFVEPEGHDLDTVYPSGISSSLPKEVQEEFISTIPGLEKAKIIQHGYAVEYDVLDTTQLDRTLMIKKMPGFYFAGQVNGTSGYEEAAGQGFIAGVNASLAFLGKKPLILPRSESYIGVMIEDLITNDRDEPYRLFTARAENRLFIREDNAFLRMCPYRTSLGLNTRLDIVLKGLFHEHLELSSLVKEVFLDGMFYVEHSEKLSRFVSEIEKKVSVSEVLKLPWLDPVKLLEYICQKSTLDFDRAVIRSVAIEVKYEGYVTRAHDQIKKIEKVDKKQLDLDRILNSENISFECKQRIQKIAPTDFAQLKRINGIRPATLAVVASGVY